MVQLTELQKRRLRQALGVKRPFAVDRVVKPFRDVDRAARADKSKVIERSGAPKVFRGNHGAFSGCMLDPAIRAIVARRRAEREQFFGGLNDA